MKIKIAPHLFFIGILLTPAIPTWAADATVFQSHSTFDVNNVTVKTGDTVVFKNGDDYRHNIRIINADGLVNDKGLQDTYVNIKETFTKAGKYDVRCAIHPAMLMTVTVQ